MYIPLKIFFSFISWLFVCFFVCVFHACGSVSGGLCVCVCTLMCLYVFPTFPTITKVACTFQTPPTSEEPHFSCDLSCEASTCGEQTIIPLVFRVLALLICLR